MKKRLSKESDEVSKTPGKLPIQPYGAEVTPVAIIGVAFRFPGDHYDENVFWNSLKKGENLVSSIPENRWGTRTLQHDKNSEPGRSITFSAGVLSRVDEFDASFFGISSREASWIDPQQRLLLELSWEVMENAGVVPSTLAGTDCGVYIGISSLDYGTRGLGDLASLSSHFMTGNTLSIAANRISYIFDLHGPSLAIDTACSSSLVALHQACESIRTGEISSAMVGGVNLLLNPYPFVGFTKASMLSADGRCKVFDESANGYVRSEGAAVVLLKPLEKAITDRDDIQAVILASGVNADGARKTGITIPSTDGQIELMERVLDRSGLLPSDIDYIEAHGTGTSVGDPIETAAIGAVYGQKRDNALPIGSIKANLGHMEPASGMAGLVKATLMLKNRGIPPSLNVDKPNPNIDFSGLNLELISTYREFQKKNNKPLTIGLNSFGFGGANAHVVLQECHLGTSQTTKQSGEQIPPILLSARCNGALQSIAINYASLLKDKSLHDFYDIAYALAYQRERLKKRLAVYADSPEKAVLALQNYTEDELPNEIILEDSLPQPGGVAFVYSGNGAQWVGMGRRLLGESQRFLEIITQLDYLISPLAGFSIIDKLNTEKPDVQFDDTRIAQPLLFAVQVACTFLLRELGIEPLAVTGHSVGEVAAAWAAGVLSLEQATRVIVTRSMAQGKTRGTGRMAAVGLSEDDAQDAITDVGGSHEVTVAAINSPGNVTLSGSPGALKRLQENLKSKHVFCRLLDLDYAFHSRQMDPIKKCLLEGLADLTPVTPSQIAFVSTVTGEKLEGSALDGGYWWRNVREPVRFSDAIVELSNLGCRVFLEIGPNAILQHYMKECLTAADIHARVLPTLRKNGDGQSSIFETALRVQLLSDQFDLDVFFPKRGRRVRLPNYPWQRERHWHPATSENRGPLTRRRVHPLLGWRLDDAEMAWENTIDPIVLPWLADHKVGGAIVFPGSAYVEMTLAAGGEWLGGQRMSIEELNILSPMVFVSDQARTIRFIFNLRDGSFQIRSRKRLSTDEWLLHVTGRVLKATDYLAVEGLGVLGEQGKKISREVHYKLASEVGLEYGPMFRGLYESYIYDDRLKGKLDLPETIRTDADYLFHPAVLDLCFQALVDFFQADIEAGHGQAFLPVKIGQLILFHAADVHFFQVSLDHIGDRSVRADFELYDSSDALVAKITDCRFRVVPLLKKDRGGVSRWGIFPRLNPHPLEPRETAFPSTKDFVEWSQQSIAGMTQERQKWFNESFLLFEALTLSFVYEAFQSFIEQDEEGLSRLLESAVPYVRWLVSLLRQEDLLFQGQEGRWQLGPRNELPASEKIWRTLLCESPSSLPQLSIIGRLGTQLPNLLRDDVNIGRDLLTELKSSPTGELLFDEDPVYIGIRLAVENSLRQLAASLPDNRRLRVLEITGAPSKLPRMVFDVLSDDRFEYVLALTEEKFYQRQQFEYEEFGNIFLASLPPEDWNLDENTEVLGKFDVIILRHVTHRTGAPQAVLAQVHRKLAQGGVLLLAERYPDWGADFVYGLDPEWWHKSSEEGAEGIAASVSSLVNPEVWMRALGDEGFSEIGEFTEAMAEERTGGAYLLIGKRSMADVQKVSVPESDTWLLLADNYSQNLVNTIQTQLEKKGQRVTVCQQASDEDLGVVRNVVHFLGWDCPAENTPALLGDLVRTVQKLATFKEKTLRLWVITHGGVLASELLEGWIANPAQGALWGFGRVVMNEYPFLDCTLIDLATCSMAPHIPSQLEKEFLFPDGSNEIVLGNGARYTLEMREIESIVGETPGNDDRYRLDFEVPGKLRNLIWLPCEVNSLEDDELEVRTQATGLNFRDVMYVMGLLPDEAVENGFAGASLGLEFSGIVTRVGAGVVDFQPGDPVLGFGSSCFASHIITKARAVTLMPENWSFEAAATVPTVYFTVYYAFCHLADLQHGERVWIHGGAGGVGIAAIRLARHLGAEVFATAGNDEKRDFVRLLGADHVFDSRSLAFADKILALTGGEGVDVVLNSLAGEAIRRNLHVLKPFGRFLELGKRDFFENTPIGLRYFKDNISYFGIDVDQLFSGRPELASRLFSELMLLFTKGVLAPLPYRVFKARRIVDAFYEMREARHIGKILVSFNDSTPQIQRHAHAGNSMNFEKSTTWLITGGLDGFGLESARWLANRGVGNLALVSRRGKNTAGASEVIAELAEQGVNAEVFSCDVTDIDALSEVMEVIRETMPSLKGIVHAAMVIDDQIIQNLSQQSVEAVLQPKLMGAWNMHLLTKDVPLDYFILYSSITTTFGNPGQANYVAANSALESLATLRKSIGLPCMCINWGPIGDVGYLTRNTEVRDNLDIRLGKAALLADEALNQLDDILDSAYCSVGVANFDWGVLSAFLPSARSNRFSVLNRRTTKVDLAGERDDFRVVMRGKSPEEVAVIVRNHVVQEVAQVLLIKAERIDLKCSLHDLGLDSLMAVELAQGLEQRFDIQLPIMMFNDSPTAEKVTSYIVEKMLGDNTREDSANSTDAIIHGLARQHGEDIPQSGLRLLEESSDKIIKASIHG